MMSAPAGSGKAAGAVRRRFDAGPGTFAMSVCITLRYSLRFPAAGAREIMQNVFHIQEDQSEQSAESRSRQDGNGRNHEDTMTRGVKGAEGQGGEPRNTPITPMAQVLFQVRLAMGASVCQNARRQLCAPETK